MTRFEQVAAVEAETVMRIDRCNQRPIILFGCGLAAGAVLGVSIGRFSGMRLEGTLAGVLFGGIVGRLAAQSRSASYIASTFIGAIASFAMVPFTLLPGAFWGLAFGFLPRLVRFPLFTVMIVFSGLCAIPYTDHTRAVLDFLMGGPSSICTLMISATCGLALHLHLRSLEESQPSDEPPGGTA